MHFNREKYEQLILESSLFSLDRETEYAAFKRESYRMVEYLYCYLLSINESEYEPYGCEITEVATRCISNYDSSKGVFLHYFNSAWKQEYSHILGKKYHEEKFRGIRVVEEDRRAVRKYIAIADRMGKDCSRDELYKRLSEVMNLPVKKIKELAQLSSTVVTGDTCTSDDGEEQSLWDQLPGMECVSQRIETAEETETVLNRIEEVFKSLQNRQKPIISDMITIRICTFLIETGVQDYSFISKSVMEEWTKNGTIPTQRDIAKKYGRDEASISRTVKVFLEKVRKGE